MAPLDERLLGEAREAQAAQLHAQAQAELARFRFTDAVGRLHQGGASCARSPAPSASATSACTSW